MMQPALMKRPDAANYLGISYWRFRGLENRGLIKPVEGTDQGKEFPLFAKADLDKLAKTEGDHGNDEGTD